MKRILTIITIFVLIFYFQNLSFAGDSKEIDLKSNIPEALRAAYEKCTNNVSYKIISKTNVDGKEYQVTTKVYFKNEKTCKFENEFMGSETIAVITPEGSWNYIKNNNTLINISDMKTMGPLDLLSNGFVMNEGKENNLSTFTFELKNEKIKGIGTIYVDTKNNLILKTIIKNLNGKAITETYYSDFKFEKQEDYLFKKPKGAKEISAPKK